jgi:hypothetical protein
VKLLREAANNIAEWVLVEQQEGWVFFMFVTVDSENLERKFFRGSYIGIKSEGREKEIKEFITHLNVCILHNKLNDLKSKL